MKKLIKILQKDEISDDKFLIALVQRCVNRDTTIFINKFFDSYESAEEYITSHNKISESFKNAVIYRLQGYAVYTR